MRRQQKIHGADTLLTLLDGIVLVCLILVIIFCSLFGIAIYDRLEKLETEVVRAHQRISHMRKKVEWLSEENERNNRDNKK